MDRRILRYGVLGGLLSTLALIPPLYLLLPARSSSAWGAGSPALGGLGMALAAALVCAAGYLASRAAGAVTPRRGLASGACTGLLAALVAFVLIGGAAAGVAGSAPVLSRGSLPDNDERELVRLLSESILRVHWSLVMMLLSLLAGGAVLGGLGGLLAARGGAAAPARQTTPIHQSNALCASMLLLVLAALQLVVITGVNSTLQRRLQAVTAEFGLVQPLPLRVAYDPLLIINMLAMALGSWLSWLLLAQLQQRAEPRQQRGYSVLAALLLALPLLALCFAGLIGGSVILVNLVFLGAAVLLLAAHGLGYQRYRRQRLGGEQAQVPTRTPRSWLDLGLLFWVVLSAVPMAGGGSAALTQVIELIPFISPTSSPPPTAPAVIHESFRYHLQFALYAGLAALLLTAISWGISRGPSWRTRDSLAASPK